MSCWIDDSSGTVIAVLIFKRDDLLYDIKNYAFIEGSISETDSNHVRHTIQDVGEDGNVDRVTRVLNLTVAKCKEMLYPYTKHNIHRQELDDKLREPGVYGIVMRVPKEYSQTSLNLLEELIHEYLVCTVVADWMSITNPTKAEMWKGKAESASREIKTGLNSRMQRVRIKTHPF